MAEMGRGVDFEMTVLDMGPVAAGHYCTYKKQWSQMEDGVEKLEPLCTAGENIKLCSRYGKQNGSFSRKLKVELPYDAEIPCLGISSKGLKPRTQTS